MSETVNKKEPSKTKVVTGMVRFSYLNAFKPKAMEGSNAEPKYSTSILIPKSDTEQIERIKKAIQAAIEIGKTKLGGKLPANFKMPLRDGDTERPDNPEYKNHWFFNASSTTKPTVVDNNRLEIEDETRVYSGMYGKASINFYFFKKAGSVGVAAGLNHIQKLKDGEPLSGRGSAQDDFVDEPGEDLAG